jgi:hypothetical protein
MNKFNNNTIFLFYQELEKFIKRKSAAQIQHLWAGTAWYQDNFSLEIHPLQSYWLDTKTLIGTMNLEFSEKISSEKIPNQYRQESEIKIASFFEEEYIEFTDYQACIAITEPYQTETKNGSFIYKIKATWCAWHKEKSSPWGIKIWSAKENTADQSKNLLETYFKNSFVIFQYFSIPQITQRNIQGSLQKDYRWITALNIIVRGKFYKDLNALLGQRVMVSILNLTQKEMQIMDTHTETNHQIPIIKLKLESCVTYEKYNH